jgi:hypothetical protein
VDRRICDLRVEEHLEAHSHSMNLKGKIITMVVLAMRTRTNKEDMVFRLGAW